MQICRRESASAQMPSQCGHSYKSVFPMRIFSMSDLQRGQRQCESGSTSVRSAFAPQCEQNFAPTNIIPKQAGQDTAASRAPQWSQWEESVEAEAPHIGQLRVSAGIILVTE